MRIVRIASALGSEGEAGLGLGSWELASPAALLCPQVSCQPTRSLCFDVSAGPRGGPLTQRSCGRDSPGQHWVWGCTQPREGLSPSSTASHLAHLQTPGVLTCPLISLPCRRTPFPTASGRFPYSTPPPSPSMSSPSCTPEPQVRALSRRACESPAWVVDLGLALLLAASQKRYSARSHYGAEPRVGGTVSCFTYSREV